MAWHIVLGPPGTGKTTTLLSLTEKFLEEGVPPHRIGYLAFTRKAANEALDRAVERFGLDKNELLYFRTIHSLCYHWLGMETSDVMSTTHYKSFSKIMGEPLSGARKLEEGGTGGLSKGDQILFHENLARNKTISAKEQWQKSGLPVSWPHMDWFCRGLEKFKEERFLRDYTDMLMLFLKEPTVPKLQVLIIDEAQDLSLLQWQCIRRLAEHAEEVYIAGDDDQAIYQWAGADTKTFVNLKGEEILLRQSYRTPTKVYEVAQGILNRVPKNNRRPKVWDPREAEGQLSFYTSHRHLDFKEGQWLVLARNNYLLHNVEESLRQQGFLYEKQNRLSVKERLLNAVQDWEILRKGSALPFSRVRTIYGHMSLNKGVARGHKTLSNVSDEQMVSLSELKSSHGLLTDKIWHEALDRIGDVEREYLIACLRRGEKVTRPRIKLSTIHGAKGGEADNVVLFTDISSKTHTELYERPDDENRAFYVAVTRTKENLHIVQPSTSKFYKPIL